MRNTLALLLVLGTVSVAVSQTCPPASATSTWIQGFIDQGGGKAMAWLPDMDGDGWSELAVSAPATQDNSSLVPSMACSSPPTGFYTVHFLSGRTGRVFASLPRTTITSQGFSLDSGGDVNGDGQPDLLIMNPCHTRNGGSRSGSIEIVDGAWIARMATAGPGVTYPFVSLRAPGHPSGSTAPGDALFGFSGKIIGDLTGDGRSEYVVSAPGEGKVYVFNGGNHAVLQTISVSNFTGTWFGYDVEWGRFQGQQVLLVSAPWRDSAGVRRAGAVDVFRTTGAAAPGLPFAGTADATLSLVGSSTDECLGTSILPAGDMTNDGSEDLVVAADPTLGGIRTASSISPSLRGQVFLFDGSVNSAPAVSFIGATQTEHFASAIAVIPDINGDGSREIVVGSRGDRSVLGLVSIHAVNRSGAAANLGALVANTALSSRALWGSCILAGDLNGDGRPEVIVGAPGMALGQRRGLVEVQTLIPCTPPQNPFPGSGTGMTLQSGVGLGPASALTASPTVKWAIPGSHLSLRIVSPSGTHNGLPIYLWMDAQVGSPSAMPTPWLPGMAVFPSHFLIGDPTPPPATSSPLPFTPIAVLPSAGQTLSFILPTSPSLQGYSLGFQGCAWDPATSQFSLTPAHFVRL